MLDPKIIVEERMLAKDAYSKWLGVELIEVRLGYAKIQMKVSADMLNGFGIAHGGISFGLADSAFAFASNSRGMLAYSISTDINHLEKVNLDDVLFAEAEEEFYNGKLGKYKVHIKNQNDQIVAIFNGMVYVTKKAWE